MSNNELTNYEPENQMERREKSAVVEGMISRQSQEVQVAMLAAKKFPRDDFESFNRIMKACERKVLAETAMYEYPKGGQKVTGPSIRMAETLAQCWGNIDFGIVELEQKNGESTVMAYAWDLETNTRQAKIFTVKHERHTKNGVTKLTDPRDIYELVANNGARRLRACILGVIPGDVTEAAVEKCKKTLLSGNTEPITDRIRKMVGAFDHEFQVNIEMLEKYIGCKVDAFSENDLLRLKGVYRSLKDGMSKREDYFELSGPQARAEEQTTEKPKSKAEKQFQKAVQPEEEPDNPFAKV
jgi:hypothetical protein